MQILTRVGRSAPVARARLRKLPSFHPPIHRDRVRDMAEPASAPVAVKEDNDYVAEVILHR